MKTLILVLSVLLFACSSREVEQAPVEDGTYIGSASPTWTPPPAKPCDQGYWPMDAADGWKRCLPIGAFIMRAYTDAKCSSPLAASDGTPVVIEGRVYQLGGMYTGPVTTMHPDCQEVPSEAIDAQLASAGLHTFQVGVEIPLDQFRIYE